MMEITAFKKSFQQLLARENYTNHPFYLALFEPEITIYQITAIDTATNTISHDGDLIPNGMALFFHAPESETLPSGLLDGVFYWVINSSASNFQVAHTPTSAQPIQLTSQGSGNCIVCALLPDTYSLDESFFGQENIEQNGYKRILHTPGEPELSGRSVIIPDKIYPLQSEGAPISFSGFFLIRDGSPHANKPIANIDPLANQIEVIAHDLSVGDRIILTVTPSNGSALPANIPPATMLYVTAVPTLNRIEVSLAQDGDPIDIADSGSGLMHLRYANGDIAYVHVIAEGAEIPAGSVYQFRTGVHNQSVDADGDVQ